jgi:hypothetical protein
MSRSELVVIFGEGFMEPNPVRAGQAATVHLPLTKRMDCSGTVTRYLTGECGYHVLWTGSAAVEQGFSGVLAIPIEIPKTIRNGTCEYRSRSAYVCTPLDYFNPRKYEIRPIDFKVMP